MGLSDAEIDAIASQRIASQGGGALSDADIDRIAEQRIDEQGSHFFRKAGEGALDTIKAVPGVIEHPIESGKNLLTNIAQNPVRSFVDIASATAGTAVGTAAGVLASPFTLGTSAIAGPIVGGAAGYALGDNAFDQVKEWLGLADPTEFKDKVDKMGYLMGQGVTLGGVQKSAGVAASGVGKTLKAPGVIADQAKTALQNKTLGVRASDIQSGLEAGAKFVDDHGFPVAPEEATAYAGKTQKLAQDFSQSILGKELPNDPAAAQLYLATATDAAGKAKSAIVDQIQQSIDDFQHNTLQKVKIEPNWKIAEDYIQSGKESAGHKLALKVQLDKLKEDWANKEQTFTGLDDFKQEIPTTGMGLNPGDTASARLNSAVYAGIVDSLNAVADSAIGEGKFQKANTAYSNLKTLQGTQARVVGRAQLQIPKPVSTLGGFGLAATTLGTTGNPFLAAMAPVAAKISGDYFPASSARGLGTLSKVLKPLTKTGAGLDALGKFLRSSGITGAAPEEALPPPRGPRATYTAKTIPDYDYKASIVPQEQIGYSPEFPTKESLFGLGGPSESLGLPEPSTRYTSGENPGSLGDYVLGDGVDLEALSRGQGRLSGPEGRLRIENTKRLGLPEPVGSYTAGEFPGRIIPTGPKSQFPMAQFNELQRGLPAPENHYTSGEHPGKIENWTMGDGVDLEKLYKDSGETGSLKIGEILHDIPARDLARAAERIGRNSAAITGIYGSGRNSQSVLSPKTKSVFAPTPTEPPEPDSVLRRRQKIADDLQAKGDNVKAIPPEVLDAVRQVESSGGKHLESHDKDGNVIAKGPYQLTDKTGMAYHKSLGIEGKYDPYDEKQSRKIALAILEDNLETFDGDLGKALTAYNSGPKNVKDGTLGPQGRAYAGKVMAELEKNRKTFA